MKTVKRGRMGTRIAAGALALAAGLTAAPAGALDVWFSQPSGWAAADVDRAAEEGLPVDLYGSGLPEAPFADLDGSTGTAYIRAAWDLGLMNGVSATEFAPGRTITRMEICTLLSRVMDKCGVDLPQTVPGVEARLDSGAEGVVPGPGTAWWTLWARG